MIHTYRLSGMHCGSCVGRVKEALEAIPGVKRAIVSLNPQEAIINMTTYLDTSLLDKSVRNAGNYALTDDVERIDTMAPRPAEAMGTAGAEAVADASATTYKPLLLILAFIVGVTLLVEVRMGGFALMRAMGTFMAGFFLVFSFFKLLDISGFAASYRMYDIVARQFPAYGLVYPFIELSLGVAYLVNYNPIVTNWVTLLVMGVSLVGVVQSVRNKRKIRCACLGSVFNLPMTTVTIVEDGLMIAMAGAMLLM